MVVRRDAHVVAPGLQPRVPRPAHRQRPAGVHPAQVHDDHRLARGEVVHGHAYAYRSHSLLVDSQGHPRRSSDTRRARDAQPAHDRPTGPGGSRGDTVFATARQESRRRWRSAWHRRSRRGRSRTARPACVRRASVRRRCGSDQGDRRQRRAQSRAHIPHISGSTGPGHLPNACGTNCSRTDVLSRRRSGGASAAETPPRAPRMSVAGHRRSAPPGASRARARPGRHRDSSA